MSRRRRRPNKGQGGGGGGGGGGGSSSPAPAQSSSKNADEGFWAEPGEGPSEPQPIRPTPQPDAVPRSLGDPPLTPDTAAQHHLAVVYEEAVRAATALAAANGLLADDEH